MTEGSSDCGRKKKLYLETAILLRRLAESARTADARAEFVRLAVLYDRIAALPVEQSPPDRVP